MKKGPGPQPFLSFQKQAETGKNRSEGTYGGGVEIFNPDIVYLGYQRKKEFYYDSLVISLVSGSLGRTSRIFFLFE